MPDNPLFPHHFSLFTSARRVQTAIQLALALMVGALFALGLAQASHASDQLPGIIGVDNRLPADMDALPWSAIGRINRETGGFCTGVLIAPNKALTAAHCLWNTRAGRWLPPDALHFVAGWRGGAYKEHARGVGIQIRPGLSFSRIGKPNRLYDDWAVIELDRPIGDIVGYVELASSLEGMATKGQRGQPVLFTAAYSADRPHLLQSHANCRPHVAVSKGPILMHDCDLTFGTSGAPIFIRSGDTYRVVAVQVAVVRNKWQERGVAAIPRIDRILAAR